MMIYINFKYKKLNRYIEIDESEFWPFNWTMNIYLIITANKIMRGNISNKVESPMNVKMSSIFKIISKFVLFKVQI